MFVLVERERNEKLIRENAISFFCAVFVFATYVFDLPSVLSGVTLSLCDMTLKAKGMTKFPNY